MNGIIVIFGISGDLAKRKIIPALYYLMLHNKLEKCMIIGAALEERTIDQLLQDAQQFVPDCDPVIWQKLASHMIYKQTNITLKNDFIQLSDFVDSLEKKYALSGNRLFYLAVAAYFFSDITQHLASSFLAVKKESTDNVWHRIVYEKPFGHNLESARMINNVIQESFNESQIYRTDHYLTKELVSNIVLVRFANIIFQPLWNNNSIEQIHIILDEKITIQDRGGYYDKYGALRDVVQNHMLQLLALITMESPTQLDNEYIRDERVKVLKDIIFVDGILGQYKDYTHEKYVSPDSETETFALLSFLIVNERWKDVPVYLKTGKALDNNYVGIHIKFKPAQCLLTQGCPVDSNWLIFTLSPEANFSVRLNIKKPGYQDSLLPVDMSFCQSALFGMRHLQAYELLFLEIMYGQRASAVRSDEIELAWSIIDTIKSHSLPLYYYDKGTAGPQEIEEYARIRKIEWYT